MIFAVQTRLDVVSSMDLGLNFLSLNIFGLSDIRVLYTHIPDMEMFNFYSVVDSLVRGAAYKALEQERPC